MTEITIERPKFDCSSCKNQQDTEYPQGSFWCACYLLKSAPKACGLGSHYKTGESFVSNVHCDPRYKKFYSDTINNIWNELKPIRDETYHNYQDVWDKLENILIDMDNEKQSASELRRGLILSGLG